MKIHHVASVISILPFAAVVILFGVSRPATAQSFVSEDTQIRIATCSAAVPMIDPDPGVIHGFAQWRALGVDQCSAQGTSGMAHITVSSVASTPNDFAFDRGECCVAGRVLID